MTTEESSFPKTPRGRAGLRKGGFLVQSFATNIGKEPCRDNFSELLKKRQPRVGDAQGREASGEGGNRVASQDGDGGAARLRQVRPEGEESARFQERVLRKDPADIVGLSFICPYI